MKRSIFSLVIMAAVSYAAEVAESGEPASTWDDMCFHCINEGNMYCVDGQSTIEKGETIWNFNDRKKGKCLEANCVQ